MNPLNTESDLSMQQVQHAIKVPNTINGLSRLNKDGLKTKVLRVGKELFVCELDADGKLNDQTKKFIQSKRIKLWHQSHNAEGKKNKHCSTCRCEENINKKVVDGSSKPKKPRGRPRKIKNPIESVNEEPIPSSTQEGENHFLESLLEKSVQK